MSPPLPIPRGPERRNRPGFWLGRKFSPPSGEYKWVYLWDAPTRAMHWLAAISIVGS